MNHKAKIFSQALQYSWGEAIIMASGLISFPILTRIFSKEQYGLFSLISVTTSLLMGISSLGGNRAVVRLYDKFGMEGRQKTFVTTLFITISCFGLSFIFIFYISANTFFSNWSVLQYASMALAIALLRMVSQNLFILVNTTFRMEQKAVLYNAAGIIRKYGAMILSVGLVVSFHTLDVFYIGNLAFDIFMLTILCIYISKMLGAITSKNNMFSIGIFKETFAYGFPLALTTIPFIVLNMGDRFIISAYLGAKEVANYSVAYNLCAYMKELIITPLNLALLPMVFKLWEKGNKEEVADILNNVIRYFFMIAIPVCMIFILISKDTITLLASEKYIESAILIPILLGGVFLQALDFPLSAGLHLNKKTNRLIFLTALAAIFNIFLNFFLIPKYGIIGGAITTILSFLVYSILLYLGARKQFKVTLPYGKIILYAIFAIFSFFCTAYYKTLININNKLINILNLSIVFILLYLFFLYIFDQDVRKNINFIAHKIFKFNSN